MLEILIAAAFGAFQAPECLVSFERGEEARIVLRLRPACTLGYSSTQLAVRALLARQASSSRRWNLAAGKPHEGHENAYVAAALRGMPEFTALFERWLITGVSVEKVLTKAAAELSLPAGAPVPSEARLPYDAILWVALRRP